MSTLDRLCPPVLSCDQARDMEAQLFRDDEALEWMAMQSAGGAVAAAVWKDFEEIGGLPAGLRLLVLVGKGHNGGDALIAARVLLENFPSATADVAFVFGERSLRPLAARAWRELVHGIGQRVNVIADVGSAEWQAAVRYDVALDGVFGFQFRPPADAAITALFAAINAMPVRLRAAIDLPSAGLFRADFTYATGSVKSPALAPAAGRLRYLDLGFFPAVDDARMDALPGDDRVLTTSVLDPLRGWRPVDSDKRKFGHVFLVGGSRGFPGAILMSVTAAVRSGAGLVTAFVPESLVPSYAARLPEAMWVGWPETPSGGLALEGQHLLRERLDRAGALVIGPGLGREAETLALVADIVRTAKIPLVLDADALQPDVVTTGNVPRVVTPHAGEFKRIAGDKALRDFAAQPGVTVVLKGPATQVCDGGPVYHSFFGGPVLARGGSGDLLAGMLGTQLAQTPDDPLGAAARAVVWHGQAADLLARAHGPVAVHTTQLLDYLASVLRGK
jgi:hydroxyethylthiazole kinase-like uncharacterized protein yjeF